MRWTKKLNWRKLWRLTVISCCIALLSGMIAAWYVAGQIVAPANHAVGPPPSDFGIEVVKFKSMSGSDLAAWYMPHAEARATVVLLHPVRADRRAMLGRAKLFHDAGYAALLVDLQAHGESRGEHITAGYRERLDVVAAVEFVRHRHPDHRVAIVGWSLGGAAALLAAPLPVDALVLESVYPTVEEAVSNRIAMRAGVLSHLLTPVLMAALRMRLGIAASELRPIDHVGQVGCPVLIASGDVDEHTTFAETTRLFDAAAEPKQLVRFNGAAHVDLLGYDSQKYMEVVQFLDKSLLPLADGR